MDELLPRAQAWGMRLLVVGLALLMLSLACGRMRNPEKFFAEKMVATGDIFVMAKSDARAEEAWARALAAQPEEAGMTLRKSDWQARTYDVWLTAPTRDAALAQLGALLDKFRENFTQDAMRDVQAFTSSWVEPKPTPKVRLWARRIRAAVLSMFATGVVMTAGGGWVLWVSVQGDKNKFADPVFNNEAPGTPPPAHGEEDEDDNDDENPPKPGPPPPPAGGEPETKVL